MLADQNEDMWDTVESLFNRRYGYRGAISDQGPTFAASPTCDVHRCAQCAAQTSPCGEILGRWGRHGRKAGGQFMPRQPMGGGAAPPTALMSSPQKSFTGKKSPPAKWTKMPGLQLGREAGRCICIKRKLMTKPWLCLERRQGGCGCAAAFKADDLSEN